MASQFCVVGATRGTGLHIARQLVLDGKKVRVVARFPEKVRQVLGDHVEIFRGDVTVASSLSAALTANCQVIIYAVDITGGIGGRSFFGASRKIREVTYQGFVNVIEIARTNGFNGRVVLLSGMGCDRRSLSGAILNSVKGNLQKNMFDRENYLKSCGLDYTVCRGAILTDGPGGRHRIKITAPVHSLSVRRKICRADFARAVIAVSQTAIASRQVYDVFGEPGANNETFDITL
ncbi:SDR family NAD(P)-dependent oxidoreductase [Pseudomonas syringae group genomosp. 3]|uniref:SDR family NAD(P)-dependent oxidoreductase n=1 Tax=Pseudomonas syringae group genomosp. 3 TaxID=251701 RepID=UPI000EFB7CA7|nr:SDR family NAD(P)-dependent oxidoreductase [Pseudomonas syringae group genomosp. 3]